jgi:hypothetical protein
MSLRQESLYPWSGLRFLTSIVISTAFVWSTYIVVGGVWGHRTQTEGLSLPAPEAKNAIDSWAFAAVPADQPRTTLFQGTASRHFRADAMTFTMSVTGKATTETGAAHAARTQTRKVHDFLLAHGITENEIVFDAAQTEQNVVGDDTVSPKVLPEYDSTQQVTITVADVERGQRAHNAAVISEDLAGVDVAAASCSTHATDDIQDQLLAEARDNLVTNAKLAMKQLGGELGTLQTADPAATVDVGTDCADIVATVSASATYVVK